MRCCQLLPTVVAEATADSFTNDSTALQTGMGDIEFLSSRNDGSFSDTPGNKGNKAHNAAQRLDFVCSVLRTVDKTGLFPYDFPKPR